MQVPRPFKRLYERLGLTVTALIALAAGAVVFVGAGGVFAGATEDATEHNGQALQDAHRLHFFVAHRSDVLVRASKVLTDIGAVPVVAAVALIASLLLWRRGLRLAVACAPLLAFGAAAVFVTVTKHLVNRARPPVSLHLVHETDASFPSGHSTDSAAVLITIALVCGVYLLRRPIARAGIVVAAGLCTGAIGLSRLVLGVHWPTDVMAGWALGLAIAVAATITTALVAQLQPPTDGTRRSIPARVLHLCTLRRVAPRHGAAAV